MSPRAHGNTADTAGQYCTRLPLWHPACATLWWTDSTAAR